jgi:molybdate transport system substrate-binding protein
MTTGALSALAIAAALTLTACGSSGDDASDTSTKSTSASPAGDLTGTLTVFAAASLTDVFGELGDQLKADNPELDIQFNFAGSSALATQLTQGAPADVFASANEAQMKVATDGRLQGEDPTIVAENVLEIAVPKGNPAKITGLSDFGNADLTLAICAPDVPCGAAATKVFQAAGITAQPDTLEEDVKAALNKVQLGEVDAALVYATDVIAAGDQVEGIEFPEAEQAINKYPICTLKAAPNPDAAQAFVDLVTSDEGQKALADAGFRTPAP